MARTCESDASKHRIGLLTTLPKSHYESKSKQGLIIFMARHAPILMDIIVMGVGGY